MGWTDVFPVLTEEMVDDFAAEASAVDLALLEEWYGTERVLNAQPEKPDIVSVSLFWKNVRPGDPELPLPTREILLAAQEQGLAERFNPWDHYVKPLLEQVPSLLDRFPDLVIRVYLAKDMEFLAEELAAAGNEVHLMKSSSIHFAPGGLWRFLALSESGKRVTVTDIDRLNDLESDLLRSQTMEQAGVGAWRVPVPVDLTEEYTVCYRPFIGGQFGVMGGIMDARQLLDAFTWHAMQGRIDSVAIYPACGPLTIHMHQWPGYGFDEYFMTVAAYPRLAQSGMITFVPTFAKSQLLTLDVEYVTWGNPNSELVYFPTDQCCGVSPDQSLQATGLTETSNDFPAPPPFVVNESVDEETESFTEPHVAFLFLTQGEHHHPDIWAEYLSIAGENRPRIHAHGNVRQFGQNDSMRLDEQVNKQIKTEVADISFVRATITLLQAAMADPSATHFMLISGSCVPVRPYSELLRSLRLDPRSRMRIQPWAEIRKWNILKAQHLENVPGIRKEIAHFQDQWICLNREDVELILSDDRTEAFEQVLAPGESYFATMLAALGRPPLQSVANRPITWTEWSEASPQPKEFLHVNGRIAAQIGDSGCFFARKFPRGSDIGRWGLHRHQQTKASASLR